MIFLFPAFSFCIFVVCLEREDQNEDKKEKLGKEERIWKTVIR
jgi:hypothetical protein